MLNSFVQGSLAEAVGWVILHSLWQGAAIAFCLVSVLLALRSPGLRYAVACAAVLTQLLVSAVTLVRVFPEAQGKSRAVAGPSISTNVILPALNAPREQGLTLKELAPWVTPFWIGGVFVFYLRSAVGFASVARLRTRGVCCSAPEWLARISDLKSKLHVSRPVRLLESCLAETPLVVGHLRPVILLPVGLLAGLPVGQIEGILMHELAHIQRHDYLVNAIQRAVEGLFFFHPAMWWISGVIRAEREKCCDDIAVSTGGDVRVYAAALAAFEKSRCTAAVAAAATGGSLVKRIRRLLVPQTPKAAWTPLFAAVVCLLTIALGLGAWQSEPGNQPPAQAERRMELARFLMNSLSSGAAYTLVDDAQRAAYLKLGTDEERLHFILQFWLRSNPATPEGDIHTEIDRRLGYADQHFQTKAGFAGSQTDRGRMYVIYGPPDEIESHPAEGREEWVYYRLQGPNGRKSFTFVERSGTGDYRLTPQPEPQG